MNILRVAASTENLSKILDFISSAAGKIGFSKDAESEILVACEEIIVNIVSYAYIPGHAGEIDIAASEKEKGTLEITISDWGRPFDPLSFPAPDVTAPLEERQIGGLGIHLARNFMDSISYHRERNMNVVVMTKKVR